MLTSKNIDEWKMVDILYIGFSSVTTWFMYDRIHFWAHEVIVQSQFS